MPEFVVYHLRATEDQIRRINGSTTNSALSNAVVDATLNGKSDDALDHDLYAPVAVVSAQDLTGVFRDTNHIESDWAQNESVLKVDTPVRSTSVGDIVLDATSGNAWTCAPIGWDEISEPTHLTLLKNMGKQFRQ